MFYTYAQIEKIEQYIEKIKELQSSSLDGAKLYDAVSHLDDMISTSYKEYDPNIHWNAAIEEDDPYGETTYNNDRILEFLEVMEASLQGILNSLECIPEICSIRDDIARGNELLQLQNVSAEEEQCCEYVRDMLLKYDSIFSRSQYSYLLGQGFNGSTHNIKTIVNALHKHLRSIDGYSVSSFSLRGSEEQTTKSANYNMPPIHITANGGNANASASAQVNVDVSVQIEQTIEKVKEACLSPEEEVAILAKLDELKGIAKEKNIRTRWDKVKGVFKWLAEQSLQAASWIVPLIAQLMQVT